MSNYQTGNVIGNATVRQNISGEMRIGGSTIRQVVSGTTEYWNSQTTLVSVKDTVYVYTDYETVEGEAIPNIKIGDGDAYVIDLPFISGSGVTAEQIANWDNKVSVMVDPTNPENIIFYTD